MTGNVTIHHYLEYLRFLDRLVDVTENEPGFFPPNVFAASIKTLSIKNKKKG